MIIKQLIIRVEFYSQVLNKYLFIGDDSCLSGRTNKKKITIFDEFPIEFNVARLFKIIINQRNKISQFDIIIIIIINH